jgi:RNA polymerase sigma-70 factor (ECF subfamily)
LETVAPVLTDVTDADRTPTLVFTEIYREFFGFVWRSARALGVRTSAVDDVVQEVFVIVHSRLAEFEGRSSIRTWLSGILLNVVRHHRRTVGRKSPHETGEAIDPDTLPAGARDPSEMAEQSEGTRLVQHILDGFDDDKREIFVLAELEELSVPEIAQALGIKVNTAYSRLRLARATFEQGVARYRARDERRLR